MTQKEEPKESSDSALDPISRISEILFGLIMVLTFTCSMSAAEIGREDVKEMLIGAIGCNLAWGIIDALLYLMTTLTSRGRVQFLLRCLRAAPTPEIARNIVSDALPTGLAGLLENEQLDFIRDRALKMESSAYLRGLKIPDFIAAGKIFLLVFFSMLPVLIPFVLLQDPHRALRISNLIAVVMLFWLGRELGRYAGKSPYFWGFSIALIGVLLVLMTIALGG